MVRVLVVAYGEQPKTEVFGFHGTKDNAKAARDFVLRFNAGVQTGRGQAFLVDENDRPKP